MAAKRIHDAPDRAEQADEGRDRADRGEEAQLPLDAVGFAQDGDAHRLVDALLDAGDLAFAGRAAFEGPAPFAQGRHEHRRHGMIVAGGELLIELVQRLARPEDLLEPRGLALEAGERDPFVDDDRPGPERGQQQEHHHGFDDDAGAQEALDDREAAAAADLGEAADIDIGGGGRVRRAQFLCRGRRAGRRGDRTSLRHRRHDQAREDDKKYRGEDALKCHGNSLVRAGARRKCAFKIGRSRAAFRQITIKYLFLREKVSTNGATMRASVAAFPLT